MDEVETNDEESTQPSFNKKSIEEQAFFAKHTLLTDEDEDSDEVKLARTVAYYYIKEEYMKHGGVPINTRDLIPTDITKLSNVELVNVMDNIELHNNITKKKDLTTRGFSTFSNLLKIASIFLQTPLLSNVGEEIQRDHVLRDSMVATVLGKGVNPPPLISTAVILTDYLSTVALRAAEYLNGSESEQDVVQGGRRSGDFSTVSSSSSD